MKDGSIFVVIFVLSHTFIKKSIYVNLYPPALLNPEVTLSPATTSVILTLSQPTNSLPANQYTATLTSSTCTNILTRMGTTTTGSVIISDLEAGIQYTVSVTATNTNTGLTSTTTTSVTTKEESMYIPNKVLFYWLKSTWLRVG